LGRSDFIQAKVDVVDIAGLVKGASKGEGLGNKFLDAIRNVDALVHVVRCFPGSGITHVEGEPDPLRDIDIIQTELMLADLALLEKAGERNRRLAGSGDKGAIKKLAFIEEIISQLNEGIIPLFDEKPSLYETALELNLLTAKKVLYAGNMDDSPQSEELYSVLEEYCTMRGRESFKIMAALESEIIELGDDDRAEYRRELGMSETGLQVFILAVYRMLGLMTYYTAATELQAWSIPRGTRAVDAAGLIHTDFAEKFIRAEVFKSEDLMEHGSETHLREKGLVRTEGKDYVVQEGDVIRYIINQ
jgi:ribosome-binding ATPase